VSSSQITARGNLTPGCYLTSVPDCFRALHIEEIDARNAPFGTDGMCSAEVVSRLVRLVGGMQRLADAVVRAGLLDPAADLRGNREGPGMEDLGVSVG
jgi:hypothetical protein